jgi:glycerol-3-phosphate dehydrogenase (NAD(P)+)
MTGTDKQRKILVLGAGNFGTCLAEHLAREGWNVDIWSRSKTLVESINSLHKNPKYLNTITLTPTLTAINHIEPSHINDYRAIVVAVPMQAVRETLKPFAQHLNKSTLLISAVKGVEISSGFFFIDLVADLFGKPLADGTVVLSGPSFAIEVAQKLPTAVVAASKDHNRASEVQKIFHTSFFRVYTSKDPIGLEVAGAMKNVVAIAAGACAGLGLQMNSMAALITRGLAEITHLGVKLGANPLTFQGLGGVGDLFLTCSSDKSRNYSLGFKLGQGMRVHEALQSLGSVAEGFTTAKAVHGLARTLNVETPIADQVFAVLYEHKPTKAALMDLISRDAKPEFTFANHE